MLIKTQLNWIDKSTNEDRFLIYRKNGTGPFVEVGEVLENIESFVDQIDINTDVTYKVTAENVKFESSGTNEVAFNIPGLRVIMSPTDEQIITVGKTGATTKFLDNSETLTESNTFTVDETYVGELILIFDDKENVTEIDFGTLAALSGNIDLTGFNNLTDFTAKNGNFSLTFDEDFIQRTNYTLDVENSIITEAKLIALINDIIVKNGGTTTDDGTDYTGSAGNTFTGRILDLGSLTIDISIITNKILYQKIQALEGVGWTISTVETVCEKTLNVDTQLAHYVVTSLERTTEVLSLERVSGKSLFVDLYDTEANAENGLSTGKLTSVPSIAGIQDWIDSNVWLSGTTYYLRFFSSDTGSSNNISTFTYKAYPTDDRPCGAIIDVGSFDSYALYSSRFILRNDYVGNLTTGTYPSLTWNNQSSLGSDLDLSRITPYSGELVGDEVQFNNKDGFLGAMRDIDNVNTTPLNNYSFVFRFKVTDLDSPTTANRNLVVLYNSADSNVQNFALRYNGTTLNLTYRQSSSVILDSFSPTIDEWVNITVSVDNGNYEMYRDGVLISSDYLSDLIDFVPNGRQIGTNAEMDIDFSVTEFIVYRKTLTPAEITYINNLLL